MDLGYQGEIYTWANNQADDFHIKESTNYDDRPNTRTKRYIKRIEQIWLNDEDSTGVVQQAWQSCKEGNIQKLRRVLEDMHSWGKD
ncbi:hypothetical protein A2U01_0039533, partial [Trifolium medium]|nr:hypothetical protein [Trifolium medium]